jgi:anti-sigma-K factor RskA
MTEDPMSHADQCGGDAAAYALGALEPDEAEAFRRHMAQCVVCRDEVNQFRRVAEELALAAPQHPVPRGLRRRVLQEVRTQARSAPARPGRRAFARLRPAYALAACLAVAIAVAGGLELASGGQGTRVIPTVHAPAVRASLKVSGTHAELVVDHLAAPAAGKIYELWIQHGDEPPAPSTLFSVTSNATAHVGVPGSVSGVRAVLVTEEPAGGTLTPTSKPLITAHL